MDYHITDLPKLSDHEYDDYHITDLPKLSDHEYDYVINDNYDDHQFLIDYKFDLIKQRYKNINKLITWLLYKNSYYYPSKV